MGAVLRMDDVLYDARMLVVALLIGFVGMALSLRFFRRACEARGRGRLWWALVTGLGAGVTLWALNLIVVLAVSDPRAPGGHAFALRPLWLSLAGAVAACAGLAGLAARPDGPRWGRPLAAALVGVCGGVLHVAAVGALRVSGELAWAPVTAGCALLWAAALAGLLAARTRRPGAARDRAGVAALAAAALAGFVALAAGAVAPHPDPGAAPPADALPGEAVALIISVLFGLTALGAQAFVALDGAGRGEAADRYRHLALHDALTGLPNRAHLRERLDEILEVARRAGPGPAGGVAVIGLDLDRFKPVNDAHGHAAGDALLVTLSARARAALGPGEILARAGGDEFIAVKHPCDRPAALEFARRLERAIRRPVEWQGADLRVGASLGIAMHPEDGADASALLYRMDLALYRAKTSPGDPVRFFDRRMDDARRSRLALATELRRGLERGEFRLRYQPQVRLADGRPLACEALLRWDRPGRGAVAPGAFLDVAEETGVIREIGAWVLHAACRAAAGWPGALRVAVNVSPAQLAQADFPESVRDALAAAGLPAARLELEVTAAALRDDRDRLAQALERLRAAGVGLSMDDYGAGAASVAALRRFRFDRIKVERGFIADLDRDPQAAGILRSILVLGRALEVSVLVKGVETEAQRRFLLREGCTEGQGWLFGAPVAGEELAARLAAPAPARAAGDTA